MTDLADLREEDRRLTHRLARWNPEWARQLLPVVGSAAQHTKLWWAAAALMSSIGGYRGRKAAAAGLASMGLAELASNAVCKRLYERSRPPQELIPHGDVHDRPNSSSFPSGHTAAAVGFTTAVAGVSSRWGVACAIPTVMVAAQRVHSGAHYPSDVAVGAAIGLASAWFTRHSPRLLLHRLL